MDADGSGDLDPTELVPIILEAAKSHGDGDYTVTQEQAVEFCKIFDDDGNGKSFGESLQSILLFVCPLLVVCFNVLSEIDLIAMKPLAFQPFLITTA